MCPECGHTEFDVILFYLGAIEAHLATCRECGCYDSLAVFEQTVFVFEREDEEDY